MPRGFRLGWKRRSCNTAQRVAQPRQDDWQLSFGMEYFLLFMQVAMFTSIRSVAYPAGAIAVSEAGSVAA